MTVKTKQPPFPQRILDKLDGFQRRHPLPALLHGVVKKFNDDEGGHLAALITYYGFLSLFPLLIVTTAVLQMLVQNNSVLRENILGSIYSYFPAIGDGLTRSLHAPSKTGLALFIGLLIMFYGAKGVANAVQHALHVVWAVPRRKRAGFPISDIRSFAIIVGGGLGMIIAALLLGYATGSSWPFLVRIACGTFGFITLFTVFWAIFTYGSSARRRPIANIPGALMAAVGLLLLQSLGGYIIAGQMSRQTGLTAQFAVTLVLLFWIYLQVRVFLLALEYNTVRAHHLYPRAMNDANPTDADHHAHELYATRDSYRQLS